MLPCVCSVMYHRRRHNLVRTSLTHSPISSFATFLFLPHCDVICGLLLNRRTATWNLFVKYIWKKQLKSLHKHSCFETQPKPYGNALQCTTGTLATMSAPVVKSLRSWQLHCICVTAFASLAWENVELHLTASETKRQPGVRLFTWCWMKVKWNKWKSCIQLMMIFSA